MENHRSTDEEIIKELRSLATSFEEYRAETKPMLDAWNAANKAGSFVMWISKVMLAVGVIVGVFYSASHLPK